MKLIKSKILFDGVRERKNLFIGFEGSEIKYVGVLKLQGAKMSHVVVYKWIRKYVGLMQNYLKKIKPKVGDAWRTDKLFLKVKGDIYLLFKI